MVNCLWRLLVNSERKDWSGMNSKSIRSVYLYKNKTLFQFYTVTNANNARYR